MNEIGIREDESGNRDLSEIETLTIINHALQKLESRARERVLNAVLAFWAHDGAPQRSPVPRQIAESSAGRPSDSPKFSEDRTPTPKEFLLEKRPLTDVERIACLAYYLTHYRDTPQYKTLDLSKLNAEAAQLKLSNPAKAVENAARAGFVVATTKGAKQVSALGELYVQALPDRQAARDAVAHAKPRKRTKRLRGVGFPDSDSDS